MKLEPPASPRALDKVDVMIAAMNALQERLENPSLPDTAPKPIKSGFMTSEFWLILATFVVSASGYVKDHTTGAVALLAATVYAVLRSVLKTR